MNGYVWVVESLADDVPRLLSVHTDRESAVLARAAYMADYRFGGTEDDYSVHGMLLNYTGVEKA